MVTRFQRELRGDLGAFWQRHAQGELEKVKADLDSGAITIDGAGVARNCIGRVLMDDLLEMVEMVTDKADGAATRAAREIEVAEALAAYRAAWRPPSGEQLAEIRAAFGEGATVVDVLTGEKIRL
ncbi:hypothetical protein [uncultured Oscillibacter sp.]|uniref:hypothetical protein n=1 Tax=uncultured Oscillibacter sp. TaxID=876091 RepID=UPI002607F584|nr:hypothetical protein [uncultured Oscillibacter sp.]